ncbi:oxidoreductase [Sphingobacteriales bacterium UPWRP_1]|nr:oxidoreductase [Sphingobacteriales bacterium TSM_CSM]PSJ77852.1 oxidoreductase [Sphingobacteriales bacterium UPWRP_1]
MKLLTPAAWHDYELIDTGGFEKLERFGQYLLRRPEPQALWQKSLPETQWETLCHAHFTRQSMAAGANNPNGNEYGHWHLKPDMPQQWWVSYHYKKMHLKMRLGLTAFKHVGIFPEQADNWNYIYDAVLQQPQQQPHRVLNLFAYTGGASLAAKAAGADVTHIDSVKQVISWSRENMEASGLNGIRWVVEDALKFTEKETRRNSQYSGIILDPPAYGRGPDGEKWLLEKQIDYLLHLCSRLLLPNGFLVLNLYSLGLSALILENLCRRHFPNARQPEFGELYTTDRSDTKLPLGIYLRFAPEKNN